MYYELKLKVTKQDDKGNDKDVTEAFICDGELFTEAEQKGLELYNGEADVTAIKRSNIREFVNQRTDEEDKIFKATIVDIFVDDDGNEKEQKYYVALFAKDVKSATELTLQFLKQGMTDFRLDEIKKTSILDII